MKNADRMVPSGVLVFRARPLVKILCLMSVAWIASAREPLEQREDFVPPPSAETEGPEQDLPEAPAESDLLGRSLIRDIETSSHDELVVWCRILGLEEEGSDKTLRNRLLAHYKLKTVSDKASAGTRISIESAGSSSYFTVDDSDDAMIRFSGEVVLTVEEANLARVHRVSADTVLFNQENETISALGNVIYDIDFGDHVEKYTGDSLIFSVKDWDGVIFRGTSSRKQPVEGQEVDFFFSAKSIRRSGENILILEDGVITSQNVEDPDYSLHAKKIWVTGVDEWGVLGAVLYMGRVPILYIPFYWDTENALFFNPVIGSKDTKGVFLQTTTYLLGRKQAKDDDFAFLGLGSSPDAEYSLTKDGLYLIKSYSGDEDAQSLSSDYIKYVFDAYSKLGFYTGLFGSLENLGILDSLEFEVSAAVSMSSNDTGQIYFNNRNGGVQTYWNSSYVGNITLPFRFGTDLSLTIAEWSLDFTWYTDPFYYYDFGYREENFDWLNYLLSQEGGIETEETVNGFDWEIEGYWNPDVGSLSPWINNLSVESLRATLYWSAKNNRAVTGSSKPDKQYDPAREFFYPSTLVLPNLQFRLSGNLPPLEIVKLSKIIDDELQGEPMEEHPEKDGEGENVQGPSAEEYRETLTELSQVQLVEGNLDYGLNDQFVFEKGFQEARTWTEPAHIDLSLKQARLRNDASAFLRYSLRFWDDLAGFEGSSSLSTYWQHHTGVSGNSPESKSDWNYTKIFWDNDFSVDIWPLQGLHSLSSSFLQYNLNANFFTWDLADGSGNSPVFKGSWISGAEDVRRHEALGKLIWRSDLFSLSTTIRSNIPPLKEKFSFIFGAGFAYAGWAANLSHQVTYEESRWKVYPLNISGAWSGLQNKISLKQSLVLDLERGFPIGANTIVQLWGFTGRLSFRRSPQYTWDKVNLQWNSGSGETFIPNELDLSYNLDWTPPPSWRNRLRYEISLNALWNINLLQPVNNVLRLTLSQNFFIFKFIDLTLSISSSNESMFLYFPQWAEELDVPGRNFFVDLAKSLNFFSPGNVDRQESHFNLDTISLSLVHNLRNWNAVLKYSGRPELVSGNYKWKSVFSFFVKWNPLPKVQQKVRLEDSDWAVDLFKNDS